MYRAYLWDDLKIISSPLYRYLGLEPKPEWLSIVIEGNVILFIFMFEQIARSNFIFISRK